MRTPFPAASRYIHSASVRHRVLPPPPGPRTPPSLCPQLWMRTEPTVLLTSGSHVSGRSVNPTLRDGPTDYGGGYITAPAGPLCGALRRFPYFCVQVVLGCCVT
uniref:Uncharacterized protein n=1 Tax=Knipowitschia caucasica TaxID=637954 RepID=A0AAV2KUB6_KNICA